LFLSWSCLSLVSSTIWGAAVVRHFTTHSNIEPQHRCTIQFKHALTDCHINYIARTHTHKKHTHTHTYSFENDVKIPWCMYSFQ
jgi:hypothetical protein